MFFWDPTYFIIIPGLLVTMWAQYKVSSTYHKYSQVYSSNGMTADQVARRLLDSQGLSYVNIEYVHGHLTDHYDPRSKVLRLSDSVYGSTSVAAIGVAAHECGHAFQDAEDYSPLRIRSAMVPVANFGSSAAWIMLLIGFIFGSYNLAMIGVILFLAFVAFQLVTLPVEFNASRRALVAIEDGGYLTGNENQGARKVLGAAALTYVAAMLVAILELVRMLILAFMADRE